MSRIVRGNADVKTVQAAASTRRDPKAVGLPTFVSVRSVDTLTIQEAEQKATDLATLTKTQVTVEVEQRMRGPLQQSLTNLEGVLDEVSKFRRELFKESEAEIIELVHKICRKVLGHEMKATPELLAQIVSQGIEIIEKEKFVTVMVNPQDLQTFLKAKPDLTAKFKDRSEIEIRSDNQIPVGTAILQTATRQLDVNVESMCDEVLGAIQQQVQEIKETGDEGDKI